MHRQAPKAPSFGILKQTPPGRNRPARLSPGRFHTAWPLKMVYRGGYGSPWMMSARPLSLVMRIEVGRPRSSRKERLNGAFRWSGRVGKGNVGVRGRRWRQGDLGAESTH